ncbi:MAG: hypothetical protein LBK00_09390 [Treponema sp.]|jgi:hypothetical protein|nr:hypothetical protein [Treponema sp.]
MKKITRNFVSISFALALCGGISGMAFAQEAAEATEPTKWSAPSISAGTGTFNIEVQTVFNGFLVTSDVKPDPDGDYPDTTINEFDDEDYTGKISFSISYDNSNTPGAGYSFGVAGGIRRVNNFGGDFEGYFDSPWGKLWLLNKQLWLRAGGPEDPWTAWDDNWSYGNDPGDGAVQLNINPAALKGLNVGVTLPVPKDELKADYPFKNMIAGFKLSEPLPYTTISAALKLKETVGKSSLKDSMDLNAALDFNFSPVQIRAELQVADFNQDEDDLKNVPLTEAVKDNKIVRSVNFQLHPRLDLSLSKLVDLGAFSLETFTVYAWIRSDPLYVSDGNGNTKISIEWAPSYKLADGIKAFLFFGGDFDVWGGDATQTEQTLKDGYAYNQIGFMLRPALEFTFGPNAGIRLRDAIYFMQTGIDPERGIKNQVQVKFWWGF